MRSLESFFFVVIVVCLTDLSTHLVHLGPDAFFITSNERLLHARMVIADAFQEVALCIPSNYYFLSQKCILGPASEIE